MKLFVCMSVIFKRWSKFCLHKSLYFSQAPACIVHTLGIRRDEQCLHQGLLGVSQQLDHSLVEGILVLLQPPSDVVWHLRTPSWTCSATEA